MPRGEWDSLIRITQLLMDKPRKHAAKNVFAVKCIDQVHMGHQSLRF